MSSAPRQIKVRTFIEDKALLGEGPFWFEDRLWWVDIDSKVLRSADAQGGDRKSYAFEQKIGVAAPIDGRRFVVGLEDGLAIFDRESGSIEFVASPEKDQPESRFNDGKCDPVGRFLAGTQNSAGGGLYSLNGQGDWKPLYSPVTCSNGLAWTADGSTMYYIDTLTREIASFPYDLATGAIGERSVAVTIPPEMGYPDGMTIDAEGNLWVGFWDGGAIRCISPRTGECLVEVKTPCSRPTSCCFGGDNFEKLFITSARGDDPADGGEVFVCEPGVHGLPGQSFRWEK